MEEGREGKGRRENMTFLHLVSIYLLSYIWIYSYTQCAGCSFLRQSCQYFWCIIRLSRHNHSYNATPLPTMYTEIFFICLQRVSYIQCLFRYHSANLSLSDIMLHFLVKMYFYNMIQNKAQTSLLIIFLNSVSKLTVTV